MKLPSAVGLALVFVSQASLYAQPVLQSEMLDAVESAVYEVVIRKPTSDSLSYAQEPPLHLLPYSVRVDDYIGLGTAFAVGPNRYLSAAHVLGPDYEGQGKGYYIRGSSGDLYAIDQVHKYSNHRDMIVFSVKEPPESRILTAARSWRVHEPVYAVGSALVEGIVVRDGVLTSRAPEDESGEWSWIRFSAAILPGDSGGPLLNVEGEVIGLVVGTSDNEGLNSALPIAEVLEFPENVGRFHERLRLSLLNMASASFSIVVERTISLPQSHEDLQQELAAERRHAMEDALARLLEENGHKVFPSGAGSQEVLHASHDVSFPAFVAEKEDGTWGIVAPSGRWSAHIGGDAVVDYGSLFGVHILRFGKPGTVSLSELAGDPSTALDIMLKSYPVYREIGDSRTRITSLGHPTRDHQYTDNYGRVWLYSEWLIEYCDRVLVQYSLPVPFGLISILKVVPSSVAAEWALKIRCLLDFVCLTLQGTLAQWKEYSSLSSLLPEVMGHVSVGFTPGESAHFVTDRFSVVWTEKTVSITEQSYLSLMMAYIMEGTLEQFERVIWDVGGAVVSDGKPGKSLLAVEKSFNPGMKNEAALARWKQVVGRDAPYDRKPFQRDDWTVVSLVNSAPQLEGLSVELEQMARTVDYLYTLSVGVEGKVGDEVMSKKMADLYSGLVVHPAETFSGMRGVPYIRRRSADLATEGGLTIFQSVRRNDRGRLREFISRRQDLEARDSRGSTPLMSALREGKTDISGMLLDAWVNVDVQDNSGFTPLQLALKHQPAEIASAVLMRTPRTRLDQPNSLGWTALAYALRYDQPENARFLIERGVDLNATTNDGWTPLTFALRHDQPENARLLIERGADLNVTDNEGWTPLMLAVRYDQPESARLLMEQGADLNATTNDGWTPLTFALRHDQPENARLLMERGADLNVTDNEGWTPLMLALRYDQPESARLLMEQGAELNATTNEGWTPLMLAVRYDQPENARLLMEQGSDLDAANTNGWTALMLALRYDQLENARLLIERGADPNATDSEGWTALMFALRYDQPENARLLIERGANPDAVNSDDWTALIFALRYDQPENARLLIEQGADLDVANSNGWTALMFALRHGQPENARLLIEQGADLDVANNNGSTALMLAVRYDKGENARLLIERGADPNVIDNDGWTPLMFTLRNDQSENARLLIEWGADPNVTDNDGWTPLTFALRHDQPENARLLIERGADPNVIDNKGWTPLMFTLRHDQPENARLLIERGADPDFANSSGGTALMFALRYEQPENARLLIERGADLNSVTNDGWTALMYALKYGQSENARLLVERGADPNSVTNEGWTPLMVAVRHDQPKNARLLMERGADANSTHSSGWSALMFALKYDQPESARLLIERGADPNSVINEGWTALMFALKYDQPENARLLIERGADPNSVTNDGWTALMFALKYDQAENARLLIERGADLTATSKSGWTALMSALKYDQPENARLLIERGADLNSTTKDGWTPLMTAVRYGGEDVVKPLVSHGASINCVNRHNWTALHFAVAHSGVRVVQLLLAGGADLNVRTGSANQTPLDMARERGKSEIVEVLLDWMNRGGEQ